METDIRAEDQVTDVAPGPNGVRRIAVLFSRLSGYMVTCLKTLQEQYGVDLLVVREPPAKEAPFDKRYFDWIGELYDKHEHDASSIQELLQNFRPQAIYMAGWYDADYLRVARAFKSKGVPVVSGLDRPWTGSLRQQIGRFLAPWYLHSAIDIMWVAGDRQRQFASRLGYRGTRCWDGIYTCDWPRFAEVYAPDASSQRPRSFLYVGRYIARKGVDVLLQAYREYRHRVSHPWPLVCVGAGEMESYLEREDDVQNEGFVQPNRLPEVMARAGALVLPSWREPWGVVVHEAATTGLPLICSDVCGAAVHLLRDGYNGYLFETGDAQHLARCMERMTAASEAQRRHMGARSHALSKQYTPQRWVDTIAHGVKMLQSHRS